MKKYVAYYRVSTKKQKKSGLGLDAQKAIVEHYTATDGADLVKEYTEAESGKSIENREILKSAIEYCLKHDYVLVVAKLDRLSRDVEHIFTIKKKLGDNFKSFDLPNTDSLTLSIFAGLAQRERELISIRTKAALKQKKKQGIKLGNPQHLTDRAREAGVIRVKKKARQNINNKRAMSMVVKCKSEGMSLKAIADELNSNGFLTSQGKQFYKTTVQRLYQRYERETRLDKIAQAQ